MEPSSPIQIDNVIVAVDGIPVEDIEQMALVTRLSKKDSGTIIYWNGKNFAEIEKKHGFSRWFNLDYTNYFGPCRHRKIAGKLHQDVSLTAITPDCFGANRCGILGIWYDQKHRLTRMMDGLPGTACWIESWRSTYSSRRYSCGWNDGSRAVKSHRWFDRFFCKTDLAT